MVRLCLGDADRHTSLHLRHLFPPLLLVRQPIDDPDELCDPIEGDHVGQCPVHHVHYPGGSGIHGDHTVYGGSDLSRTCRLFWLLLVSVLNGYKFTADGRVLGEAFTRPSFVLKGIILNLLLHLECDQESVRVHLSRHANEWNRSPTDRAAEHQHVRDAGANVRAE